MLRSTLLTVSYLLLTNILLGQELFDNTIKLHKIENTYVKRGLSLLIEKEHTYEENFRNGRGYLIVRKVQDPKNRSVLRYEMHVQYAAIDLETDVLFPEYYGYYEKRLVMFFLDETANFTYSSGEKSAFLRKLEPYLAPKEKAIKVVNGKKVRDKNFRPENKYKLNPKKVYISFKPNASPVIASDFPL